MGESDDASDQGPDTPEGRETDAAGERTPTRYPSSDEGISDNVYSASFDVALRNAIEDGYTAARSLIQRVAAAARNAVLPARRPGRAASVRRRTGLRALAIAPELAHTQSPRPARTHPRHPTTSPLSQTGCFAPGPARADGRLGSIPTCFHRCVRCGGWTTGARSWSLRSPVN